MAEKIIDVIWERINDFFIVCRFLSFVINYDHDNIWHVMPKNDDIKSWYGFELFILSHESDKTSKRFNADFHGSIAILFRFF